MIQSYRILYTVSLPLIPEGLVELQLEASPTTKVVYLKKMM